MLSKSFRIILNFIVGILWWIKNNSDFLSFIITLLAFIIALASFIINNHKKLKQKFDYICNDNLYNITTVINIYNESLVTETSRFMGIIVTAKKPNWLRKKRLQCKIKKEEKSDNDGLLYPFIKMINIQCYEEIKETYFIPIKSHEMRKIQIDKTSFFEAVKNRLDDNIDALTNFVKEKTFYLYFVHETMNGKIKMFATRVTINDPIGKELNIDACKEKLRSIKYNK